MGTGVNLGRGTFLMETVCFEPARFGSDWIEHDAAVTDESVFVPAAATYVYLY